MYAISGLFAEFRIRNSNSVVRQLVRFRVVPITMTELAGWFLTRRPGWGPVHPFQVTFKTPKTSLAGSSSSPLDPGLDRLPFRGLITTSPQCFGTAPGFVDAESAGVSDSTVVTTTECSRAFEDEEETELWSVACG